jgi:hypothetical protein
MEKDFITNLKKVLNTLKILFCRYFRILEFFYGFPMFNGCYKKDFKFKSSLGFLLRLKWFIFSTKSLFDFLVGGKRS